MPSLPPLNMLQTDAETGLKQLDVVSDAIRSLTEIGITFPVKPKNGFDGTLPPLSDVDDDELGDLLQQLNEWIGFVEVEFAKVEGELEVSKAQYEFIQANVRIFLKSNGEGKMTVQDKTDAMRNDKRVADAHSRYLFNFTKYNILRALRNKSQGAWDTVSRRITQRLAEKDRSKRGENVMGATSPLTTRFRRG